MNETRAEEARRLVDEGRVEIVQQSPHIIEAIVKGDHDIHNTHVYANNHFFCTCAWIRPYSGDLCTHALAVKLAVEKEG